MPTLFTYSCVLCEWRGRLWLASGIMQETTKYNKVFTPRCNIAFFSPLGSRTLELYCMSCSDEEQHNLGVICFCFMLICVILKCKCTEMIGSGAAGDGNRKRRSCAYTAAKREMKDKKCTSPTVEQKKYLLFVDFLFHITVFMVRLMGMRLVFVLYAQHNPTDQTYRRCHTSVVFIQRPIWNDLGGLCPIRRQVCDQAYRRLTVECVQWVRWMWTPWRYLCLQHLYVQFADIPVKYPNDSERELRMTGDNQNIW